MWDSFIQGQQGYIDKRDYFILVSLFNIVGINRFLGYISIVIDHSKNTVICCQTNSTFSSDKLRETDKIGLFFVLWLISFYPLKSESASEEKV